jgi:hypothetical protein
MTLDSIIRTCRRNTVLSAVIVSFALLLLPLAMQTFDQARQALSGINMQSPARLIATERNVLHRAPDIRAVDDASQRIIVVRESRHRAN